MAIAIAFAFLYACGAASGSVLLRVGTQKTPPPTAALLTVLSGMVPILSLALLLNLDDIKSLSLEAMAWIVLMGIMAYPMARLLWVIAISMVGASRTSTMSGVQPVIACTLGVLLLGERPNLLIIVGTPIIVAGLFLVIFPRKSENVGVDAVQVRRLGYFAALAGAATFGTRDVISRHVVSEISDPLVTAGLALVVGSLILTMALHRQAIRSIRTVPRNHLLICAVAGVLQGLSLASLFQALSGAPVTVVSPIIALTPVITLILAHTFVKRLEAIDLLLVAGTMLSVLGVILVILGATA